MIEQIDLLTEVLKAAKCAYEEKENTAPQYNYQKPDEKPSDTTAIVTPPPPKVTTGY